MKRLREQGLMFGNLMPVNAPVLVRRYNDALEHLIGVRTDLTSFHIDISGYSPEIGEALGDRQYLNHSGVNRQFILLSVQQKKAPLLEAKFSTSRGILRQFIDQNEAQLIALTARDAVTGELLNSIYDVSHPNRLLDVRNVRIEADTPSGAVANAGHLAQLVKRFHTEPQGWADDALIAEMIKAARTTGNVINNPVRFEAVDFEQANFWTAHFGGTFLFRTVPHPAAIGSAPERLDGLDLDYVFGLQDVGRIAHFLALNDLVEPLVKARGADAVAILQQKMDFILVDVAAESGLDLTGLTRRDFRRLARENSGVLPEVWHALDGLRRWAVDGGKWPKISSDNPAYFYALRAKPGPDSELVNRLLAALTPLDVRQLFICHKEAFYDRYATWSENKQAFVAEFLAREYQVDKEGARAALFGHDAPMEEPTLRPGPWGTPGLAKERQPSNQQRDMIAAVSPWGAVGKRRR